MTCIEISDLTTADSKSLAGANSFLNELEKTATTQIFGGYGCKSYYKPEPEYYYEPEPEHYYEPEPEYSYEPEPEPKHCYKPEPEYCYKPCYKPSYC